MPEPVTGSAFYRPLIAIEDSGHQQFSLPENFSKNSKDTEERFCLCLYHLL
jgi:hypothetical protein